MAQPPALLVKRVRISDRGNIVGDVVAADGSEFAQLLHEMNRGTLVRAAMNVGVAANAAGRKGWHEWTDEQKRDAIMTAVLDDSYVPREFVIGAGKAGTANRADGAVDGAATSTSTATGVTGSLVKTAAAASNGDATAAALAALVATLQPAAATIDETAVRAMVTAAMGVELDQRIAHLAPQVTNISIANRETVTITGRQHAQFAEVLPLIAEDREHVYLFGPPGTGKTHLAMSIATALGLKFASISCSPDMMSSRLLGYSDANGKYVRTAYRDAFEFGWLFLLDEGDNATGSVLAVLNQGLSNGGMQFPDEFVTMHTDFACILAANTIGTGPTAQFPGRSALDAATLNRFARVGIPYDTVLERDLLHAAWPDSNGKVDAIHADIQRYRTNIESLGLRVFLTPRDSLRIVKQVRRGVKQSDAELAAGLIAVPEDQLRKIRGN